MVIRMVKITRPSIPSAGKDVEELELHDSQWEHKTVQTLWKSLAVT